MADSKSTNVSKAAPANIGKSPEKTQTSNPKNREKFVDFQKRNTKELSEKVFSKFNLSDPMLGVCLYSSEITESDLIQRTSASFVATFAPSAIQPKYYEHYVHIDGISDYVNSLTIETLETYLKLRASYKTLTAAKLQDFEKGSDLRALKKSFPTDKKMREFLLKAEKKIKSFHRFYSCDSKVKGNLIVCEVKFADKANLEYGWFNGAKTDSKVEIERTFIDRVNSALKELNISMKKHDKHQKIRNSSTTLESFGGDFA